MLRSGLDDCLVVSMVMVSGVAVSGLIVSGSISSGLVSIMIVDSTSTFSSFLSFSSSASAYLADALLFA